MSRATNHVVDVTHPTRALDATEVNGVRSELLARRAEHSARFQSAQSQTTTVTHDGAVDVGVVFERFSLDLSREAMLDIDAAVARLDDGTYGSCQACQHPIAVERLKAVPDARYCISCAGSAPFAPPDRRQP